MGKSLAQILKGLESIEVYKNAPSKSYSYMRTGGIIKTLIVPNSKDSLIKLLKILDGGGFEYRVIGKGSNILFSDKPIKTIIICTCKIDNIDIDGENIAAECGAGLSALCMKCANLGLSGLEFACGIPGSVGGAIISNAGAFGQSISQSVVKVFTDKDCDGIENLNCKFGYRSSVFANGSKTITEVKFKMIKKDRHKIKEKIVENIIKRKESQPCGYNLGSIFKNGQGFFAAELIERAGLKGLSINGAKVSKKHANFIINYDNATSFDIVNLIREVKDRVFERSKIQLVEEIQYIGDFK